MDDFAPTRFRGIVHCEQPSNRIHHFNGYMCVAERRPTSAIPMQRLYVSHYAGAKSKEAIDKSNLLLRGCSMRNVDYVEGLVLYAGRDTKAMLNNSGPRHKRSQLERLINRDIIRYFACRP